MAKTISEYKLRKLRKHLNDRIAYWTEKRRSHIEAQHPHYIVRGPTRGCEWCRTMRHTLGELETVALFFAKKVLLVLLVAFTFSGCNSFRRLVGADSHEKHVENIAGLWGGTIDLDGRTQNIHVELIQDGETIVGGTVGGSYLSIDYTGTMMARVSGSVNDHAFNLVIDNGSQCIHSFTASGEVRDGTMVATISGPGNPASGSCYPNAINQTVALHR